MGFLTHSLDVSTCDRMILDFSGGRCMLVLCRLWNKNWQDCATRRIMREFGCLVWLLAHAQRKSGTRKTKWNFWRNTRAFVVEVFPTSRTVLANADSPRPPRQKFRTPYITQIPQSGHRIVSPVTEWHNLSNPDIKTMNYTMRCTFYRLILLFLNIQRTQRRKITKTHCVHSISRRTHLLALTIICTLWTH